MGTIPAHTFFAIPWGLDTAQAMLSHSSARQTEGHARLDVNELVTGVILRAEKLFEKSVTKLQPERNVGINNLRL